MINNLLLVFSFQTYYIARLTPVLKIYCRSVETAGIVYI